MKTKKQAKPSMSLEAWRDRVWEESRRKFIDQAEEDRHTRLSGARPRFANQRHAMLYGFSLAGEDGYTDEQAAKAASLNLRSCYWKRASELRQFGYLESMKDSGAPLTRKSDLGGMQQVWRITRAGKHQLEMWGSR